LRVSAAASHDLNDIPEVNLKNPCGDLQSLAREICSKTLIARHCRIWVPKCDFSTEQINGITQMA